MSASFARVPARVVTIFVGAVAGGLTFVQYLPIVRGTALYELTFLATHLGAALSVVFILFDWRNRRESDASVSWIDFFLALLALACAGYFAAQGERVHARMAGVDLVYTADIVFGSGLILLLIEAVRRATGSVLAIIAVLFIGFAFLGPYLPPPLNHRGLTLARFIDLQVLSDQGIFGTPISASANMVFYFILVGAFLQGSGAGKLFVDLAYFLTARSWGGPAKAAVIASGMLGTVSGSAISNVLISGIVTIPLMKRTGFSATMAGAIEATASTGGQLAPPVMGAAAFVMADILGVSYADIVVAAIVPAIFYYVALFLVVDSYARRRGLGPDTSQSVSRFLDGILERWHLILPLFVMIFMLMSRYSLQLTGAVTLLVIIAISGLRPSTRMGLLVICRSVLGGVRAVVEVAIPSAAAGIIVGTLVYTGMSLRLQRGLLDLAGDSMGLVLFGAMILTIIFGMGMPTTAAYLVSAILIAPALQELGIPAIAAHLFILYFSILSMVTPPVALASYAAAGISGANVWNSGLTAFALAIPGFLIPYAFTMDPAIILQGNAPHIIYMCTTIAIGIAGLAAATGGYAFGPLGWPWRVALFCFAPLLIAPDITTDLIGVIGCVFVLGCQLWRYRFSPTVNARASDRGSGVVRNSSS